MPDVVPFDAMSVPIPLQATRTEHIEGLVIAAQARIFEQGLCSSMAAQRALEHVLHRLIKQLVALDTA